MQLKKEFLELSTNFNNNINEDKLLFIGMFLNLYMSKSNFKNKSEVQKHFPSLSVQKLKYKCKVPLIQNFTLLFYLFFLLCTNLYHNNLILLILLFLFSILFLVIYLTLSFLHFLVIYNIHLLSWLLLRYS